MKNLKIINVKELSLESKIIISAGENGDAAGVLGYVFGVYVGAEASLLGAIGGFFSSFGVSELGACGYAGCKI